MIAELRALAEFAERGQGPVRGRALSFTLLWVATEWTSFYTVLRGFERQRAGELPLAELLVFLLAEAGYLWTLRAGNRFFAARATSAARESVAAIAGRLHRLPLIEFEGVGRGVLLTRLLGDGNRIARAGRPVIQVLNSSLRVLVSLAFVALLSFDAATLAALVGLFVVVLSVARFELMSKGFRRIARHEAELFDVVHDQRLGAAAIRLHAPRAAAIVARYRRLSASLHDLRVDIWSRYFEGQYAYNALIYALLGLNTFVLPQFIALDDVALQEINLAILYLFFAVVQLVFAIPPLEEAALAAGRLRALAEQLEDDRLEPANHAVGPGRFADFRRIRLDGLGFRHAPRAGRPGFEFEPISLELGRGELVFVTGPNGSGKSTFLKLLCGLYRAERGQILIDEQPVEPDDLPHLRALFATIFVDHHLFERVVDGEDPQRAARAEALIDELGLRGKTELRGGRLSRVALSTGQRKRLAMVVARLRDRPILLFDEWAADQDPEFRRYYYEELLPALRDEGKLVLVVSHDDQHFHLADRRIVLDQGRVVAEVRR